MVEEIPSCDPDDDDFEKLVEAAFLAASHRVVERHSLRNAGHYLARRQNDRGGPTDD